MAFVAGLVGRMRGDIGAESLEAACKESDGFEAFWFNPRLVFQGRSCHRCVSTKNPPWYISFMHTAPRFNGRAAAAGHMYYL